MLGDRLGLYRALAEVGPADSAKPRTVSAFLDWGVLLMHAPCVSHRIQELTGESWVFRDARDTRQFHAQNNGALAVVAEAGDLAAAMRVKLAQNE